MQPEQSPFDAALAALEAQRGLPGDAVADALIAAARERLATPGEPGRIAGSAQSLRQVTILFLNVVGSTALAQSLDPEETSAVMDGALARAATVVRAQRGKVMQFAGDSVLAAFGVEETREDDAQRAVSCGLALLELGRVVGREAEETYRHTGCDFRIGIHTGAVLLGGGVDGDGTIRGVAVNIAARMEQTAPPGALRISHDTYAQVRGLFDVVAQEPLWVKGIDVPVQSYLVMRAMPRNFYVGSRGIEGVATRMVGRDQELDALQSAFARLLAERGLAAITVAADAGIGKSRLLFEFAAWCETRPETFLTLRARATPQTQGQPFGLLRDLFAWRFQIADDDTLEAAQAKMEEGIAPLFLPDEGPARAQAHAHLLGHLIGIEWRDSPHLKGIIEEPRLIRQRAFESGTQWFRRFSERNRHPIVLQLEDLHWADNESLDLLKHLTAMAPPLPMLVVALTRPSLFERRAEWVGNAAVHRRIDLAPLGAAASVELANELLKKLADVPAALRALMTRAAEGNPFYMEELVKMLIDEKAIETGQTWKVHPERLMVTKVPPTLTGVVQARLDALPPVERATLQGASVIGPVFWDRALFALDRAAVVTLPSLVSRDLALPRAEAAHDDLREYAFKHAILHQVVYATVLKRDKRALHGKIGAWLAAWPGARANDFIGVAAEHFEQAGDDANAAEFHTRAAEHARERLAHETALKHVHSAFRLLDKSNGNDTSRPRWRLRWRLLVAREQTCESLADRESQRVDIDAMGALAEALDDDGLRAHAARLRSSLALGSGDWAAVAGEARQCIAWANSAGDAACRLSAQRNLAGAQAFLGDAAASTVLARATLAEIRALGLTHIEGACLNMMAVVADRQGDVVGMLDLHQQTLDFHRSRDNRRGEAASQINVGICWLLLGDLAQAQQELNEGSQLARRIDDRALGCPSLPNLSTLALWAGDAVGALALAREGVAATVAFRARPWEAIALTRQGDAELALGRHADAAQSYERARSIGAELHSPYEHDGCAGLARVALAGNDTATALQAIDALLVHAANIDPGADPVEGTDLPRLVEWTCHRVLARAGDPRAAAWLGRAHEAMQAHASRISDPAARGGFLTNIPYHRDIAAAWVASRMT